MILELGGRSFRLAGLNRDDSLPAILELPIPPKIGCDFYCSLPHSKETNTRFRLCGRCRLVRYCSKDCQRFDWILYHKKICSPPPVHPDSTVSLTPVQTENLHYQLLASRSLILYSNYAESWVRWIEKYVLSIKDSSYFATFGSFYLDTFLREVGTNTALMLDAKHGWSILHYAAYYNAHLAIQHILRYAAVDDENVLSTPTPNVDRKYANLTPLHVAATFNCQDAIRALLDGGFSSEKVDGLDR